MLRITREATDGTVWLRLEGKLVGPWVDECRRACGQELARSACSPETERRGPRAQPAAHARRIALDLSQVTFVDREGVQLLHQLAESGVEMPLRSSFVAELLRVEKS